MLKASMNHQCSCDGRGCPNGRARSGGKCAFLRNDRRAGPAGRPRFACEDRAGTRPHPCPLFRRFDHRVIAMALSPSQTKISPSPLGAGHPPGSRGRTYEGPLGESLGARYRIAHEAPRTAHIGRRRQRVDPAGARRALPIGRISRCNVCDGRGVPAIGSAGYDCVPARGDEEARVWASPAGAVAFLGKPFDTEALQRLVEAALRDRQQEEVVKHARAAG